MVATHTTTSYPTPSAIQEATVSELALRLERGWRLIEERQQYGKPVETYELHWLQLLAKYENRVNG